MTLQDEYNKLSEWKNAGCFLDFGKFGSVATWKIENTREWAGHLQVLCPFDRVGGNGKRWMPLADVKRAWVWEMV